MLPRLDLRTTGMEFASEMVIRAAKEKLDVRQFPIEYHPRGGESKLSSFRDGWRHLRFLLVHSPNYLFILPGAVMAALGAVVELIVIARLPRVRPRLGHPRADRRRAAGDRRHPGRRARDLRPRVRHLLHGRADRWFDRMRARFKLEHGLLLGGGIAIAGFVVGDRDRDRLDQPRLRRARKERLAVLAATLIIVGIQIFFSSFLLSILGLRRAPATQREAAASAKARS